MLRPREYLVPLTLLACINYLICSCNSIIPSVFIIKVESSLPTPPQLNHHTFLALVWTHGFVYLFVCLLSGL